MGHKYGSDLIDEKTGFNFLIIHKEEVQYSSYLPLPSADREPW